MLNIVTQQFSGKEKDDLAKTLAMRQLVAIMLLIQRQQPSCDVSSVHDNSYHVGQWVT
jgi:hypothetical protein